MEYPIHPKANAFAMMSDEELQDMAESIKIDGLLFPITLAEWTENKKKIEGIIDGRNRREACEIAGVKPTYKFFDGDEDAIIRYIVNANIHRRNLSQGQKAMGIAILYPDGTTYKGAGKEIDPAKIAAETAVVSKRRLQAARYVQKHKPEWVQDIVSGKMSLDTAITEIRKTEAEVVKLREAEEKRREQFKKELDRIRDEDPGLASDIEAENISLKEARSILKQREEIDEEVDELRKHKFDDLADAVENNEMTVEQAEEKVEERAKEATRKAKLKTLNEHDSSLAEQVESDKLSLDKAEEIMKRAKNYWETFKRWEMAVIEQSIAADRLVKHLEEYDDLLSQTDKIRVDALLHRVIVTQERWANVVKTIRKYTDTRNQLNVVNIKEN